jgi:type IV fimbrial biogenesis protein FimT
MATPSSPLAGVFGLPRAVTQIRGFTLIELLVTVAVMAVLMRLGAPSFQYILNSSRISRELNSLLISLQYARAEAIKQGVPASVCASSTATSSTPTCSGQSNWLTGWMVFVDLNGNGAYDTGDTLLRQQAGYSSSDSFQSDGTSQASAFTFNREGFLISPTTNPSMVILKPGNAGTTTTWTRCLVLTKVGQLTIQQNSSMSACQ